VSTTVRRRRAFLLLSLALACGGLAASQVAGRMREVEASVGAPVKVLVTARDVGPGSELRRGDLAVREVPESFAPPDALASADEVVGLPVAGPLPRGAYLTAAALAAPGTPEEGPGGVPRGLRRGERAVEVAVAGAGALGETALPGSRVDVLVSTDAREGPGRTLLALEDVELLALGGRGDAGAVVADGEGAAATASGSATLRVTVGQAVYLTAAQNFAREVRLLPRPPGDRQRAGREAVSAEDL